MRLPRVSATWPGPVAAHVVEGAQLAVQGVGDDDRLVEDRDRDEITDALEVLGTRHQLPGAPEDAVLLCLEDRGSM